MKIFARYGLTAAQWARTAPSGTTTADGETALLLEGSWPQASTGGAGDSLDDAIDARFAWIDAAAASLADEAAEFWPCAAGNLSPAYSYALALRYHLVKLLRVVAYFQDDLPHPPATCQFHGTQGKDDDYAQLLHLVGRSLGFQVETHWQPGSELVSSEVRVAAAALRSGAARLNQWLDRAIPSPGSSGTRIVFQGNPRVLEPVCDELVRRRGQAWWLYDRFAFRAWWRWRRRGVRQLTCNANSTRFTGSTARKALSSHPRALDRQGQLPRLAVRDFDLAPLVARWLEDKIAMNATRQEGFYQGCLEHLQRVSPHAVVLDEDATPHARAAVAAARKLSIPSWVVQHGVPGVRFGFTPLAADAFCASDNGSRQQLLEWGAEPDRIRVTGSAALESLERRVAGLPVQRRGTSRLATAGPTFLLLATPPPRDERPDAVTFHLTTRTYERMLEAAGAAVARFVGATLIVKPHPRDSHPARLLARLKKPGRLVVASAPHTPLERLLIQADVVLSCASTAGVEAAALGWPVIQIFPEGSGAMLSTEPCNLLATVRSEQELANWIPRALERATQRCRRTHSRTASSTSAAARIVDLIERETTPSRQTVDLAQHAPPIEPLVPSPL